MYFLRPFPQHRETVNDMVKLLNVTHLVGFPFDVNGNLQRALYEAIHVAKLGVRVNFIVSQEVVHENILARSMPERYRNIPNLTICPVKSLIPRGSVGWRINNLLALPIEAFKLTRIYKQTILHVHAPTPVTKPFSGSVIKKLSKLPMVLDLHDPWSNNPFSLSPIMLLQNEMMRYAIGNADMIVTPHRGLITLLKMVNKRKPVTLLPNGVDTEIFQPRPRSLTLMKMLNFSSEDTIVIFSGHITEEKGLDVLAYAAKIITRQHKNIKFLIVGEGPIKNKIETLVNSLGLQSFFRFTGFVDVEVLVEYLSLGDISVAPYIPKPMHNIMRIETPMKVVQHMSMGKPVIMSRVSDENVVSWSGGGILINPGDPEKLAEAIISLIEDEKSRKIMGGKGREYVKRNLGWSSIAEKLIEIYQLLSS